MLKTKSILIRYLEVEIFQAEGLKLQSSKKSVLRCKIARDSVHVVRIVVSLTSPKRRSLDLAPWT